MAILVKNAGGGSGGIKFTIDGVKQKEETWLKTFVGSDGETYYKRVGA